jgi:hypothetical protein
MSDGTPKVPFWSGGKTLQAAGGGPGNPLADLLVAGHDFYYNAFEDDFRGDALNAIYPAAKTNGTAAAVTFTEHNNGKLEFVTGTDDNGYAGQGLGLQYNGDRGILAEFLVTLPSSLADFKFEVGLTDADDDAGAVDVKATPTATATDFAVVCYDSDDDSTLQLIHAKAGSVAAVEFSLTPAVSTQYHIAIRVVGDDVKAMVKSVGTAGTGAREEVVANGTAGAGLEGGNDLTPWVFAQARAGSASKTLDLNKWRVVEPSW